MATTTTSSKTTSKSAAKPKSAGSGTKQIKAVSRTVTRDVEAGSTVDCTHCGERVKFQAKVRHKQVICNVYESGKWVRVEHYHSECYVTAGSIYGEPEAAIDYRRRGAAAAAAAKPAEATKS